MYVRKMFDNKLRLLGIGVLIASIAFALTSMNNTADSTSVFSEIERENQRFIELYPEIEHDHPPLECDEDTPGFACSEAYYHRDDIRIRDWYVAQAWIESIMECGTQTDILHTDGKHPVGHQVFTYRDCDENEFMKATPTADLNHSAE